MAFLKRKQSEKQFTELFTAYEADLYRIAFVYVKNEQDALDVMQETAYRAYKNFDRLREPKYCKTWLTRITINCAIDHIRKHSKLLPLEQYAENLPVLSHEEEQHIILRTSLEQLMDFLDPMEKSIVLLKYYEQCTFREIADALSIPQGTVKTILYRALHKLKTKLKEEELT